MLKIILLSALAIGITMLVIRKVPRFRVYAQRVLQNPIVRTILFRGFWRLVQCLYQGVSKMLNKSLTTNLIALAIIGASFLSPKYSEIMYLTGLFALSGGITNWLAIHMLFEKVPFFYGSGIVPSRFEEK